MRNRLIDQLDLIHPASAAERAQWQDAHDWVASGASLHRTAKHLVSYFPVHLLLDHKNAMPFRRAARHAALLALMCTAAAPAPAMMCWGPDLHSLRMLDTTTLEVQGLGGKAQTRDGGKTWTPVSTTSGPDRAFDDRVFHAAGGHDLQNLVTGEGQVVVLERMPPREHWQIRESGLLLSAHGHSAFVYRGSLSRQPGTGHWQLVDGIVTEDAVGDSAEPDRGGHPDFKIKFTSGNLCMWTGAPGLTEGPCVPPAWFGDSAAPFELTGFAVALAEPGDADDLPSRDVFLSGRSGILHWQGSTGRWNHVPPPPGWLQCNGPIPGQGVPVAPR